MNKIIMTASNISVSKLKSNRKYFSVSMRMFSTRPNENGCVVTEAFIDDIIANADDYVCMPLCADTAKLKKKDYRGLTHLYNPDEAEFLADEIGSFHDFEKVSDEYGVSLYGVARINKRSKRVCEAIQELYARSELNFSFEIAAGCVQVINGVTIVDVHEKNELTGMAIVSIPAYPEAKALSLVAEADLNRLYEKADIQISELDFEAVERRFYMKLRECLGEDYYAQRVLFFCMDSVILYDPGNAKLFKVEYRLDNDEMIFTDMYEVKIVRAEGCERDMDMENKELMSDKGTTATPETAQVQELELNAPDTVKIAQAEVQEGEVVEVLAANSADIEKAEPETAEEMTKEEPKSEPEVEPESKPEDEPKDDKELEALRKRCSELEAQLAELSVVKAELERIQNEKAEAEKAAEKDALRKYASAEGLNVEDTLVSELIEKLDHKAIMAQVMASKEQKPVTTRTVSYFAESLEIKPQGFGYLLERSGK